MKKKLLSFLLAGSLIFGSLGFASGNMENINIDPVEIANIVSNKDIKIKTKTIEEKQGNIDVKIDLPVISGLKDKGFQEAINNRIEEETRESLASFLGESKGKRGEFFINYSIKSKGKIISIVIEEYKNIESMANASNIVRTYNMSTASSDYLELRDLFLEESNYRDRIDKLIYREIDKNKELYIQGDEGFTGLKGGEKFFIDKELNLFIVYDQDEIAAHSTGVVKFKVDLNDLREILDLSGKIKARNYENDKYEFGFRMSKLWEDRVEVRENDDPKTGLFQVDFIYKPINSKLDNTNLLTLKVRDLDDDNFLKDEYELESGKYKYSAIYYNLKENPYKEDKEEAKNFKLLESVLDGTEDLFMIYDSQDGSKYLSEKYNFEFNLAPIWKDFVLVRENEKPINALFELDFLFTPSNKKDKSVDFFTLSIRDLKDRKLKENEELLGEGDYLYVGEYKALKTLPYDKDSRSRQEFVRVNDVLNGVAELIDIKVNEEDIKDMKNIVINGEKLGLKNEIYLSENGVLMLPIREIGEKLGFIVNWDGSNRLVSLEKMPITAGIYVDTNKNFFSKALINLEERSEIVNKRTYVPESFFSEVLIGHTTIDEKGILNIEY